jgi:hypothetical protein
MPSGRSGLNGTNTIATWDMGPGRLELDGFAALADRVDAASDSMMASSTWRWLGMVRWTWRDLGRGQA